VQQEPDVSAAAVERSCTDSLRRLGTDVVDLFQLHVGDLDPALADDVVATLEDLVGKGMIRAYGWSTDDVDRAWRFAQGPHCAAVQLRLNVLEDAPDLLALCEQQGLAAVNRSPLAMGLLAGATTRPPASRRRTCARTPSAGRTTSSTDGPTRGGWRGWARSARS
jgi:aryl-alcohol dehydrogenase-like predicted oxidoreductase